MWGVQLPDGGYNGLIGELMAGRIDLVDSAMGMNLRRHQIMDFTQPTYAISINMFVKKPSRSDISVVAFTSEFNVRRPNEYAVICQSIPNQMLSFQYDIWIVSWMVGFLMLVTFLLLFCFTKHRHSHFDNFVETVQIIFNAVINKGTRLRSPMVKWSMRVAFFTVLICFYVLFTAYR